MIMVYVAEKKFSDHAAVVESTRVILLKILQGNYFMSCNPPAKFHPNLTCFPATVKYSKVVVAIMM